MKLRFRDCIACGRADHVGGRAGDAIARFVARGRDEKRATLRQLMSVDPPPDPLAIGNLPSDGASPDLEDGAGRDGVLVASYPAGYTAKRVGDEVRIYAKSAFTPAMTIADIQARNRQLWEDARPSSVADRALSAVAANEVLPMPARLRAINAHNARHYAGAAS